MREAMLIGGLDHEEGSSDRSRDAVGNRTARTAESFRQLGPEGGSPEYAPLDSRFHPDVPPPSRNRNDKISHPIQGK